MSPNSLFPNRTTSLLTSQILSLMIQSRPFDADLAASLLPFAPSLLTHDTISATLQSIPRFFFRSTRSLGIQNSPRHRTPLKQRSLRAESKAHLVLGPAAHRDPERVSLGVIKAKEFFLWVETHLGFEHDESTCRFMACVLARAAALNDLWKFLKETSRRKDGFNLVRPSTITCLIKVLGEEGLVNEALTLFNQMKRYRCRPDVCAYNTMIYALCKVGNFRKARWLLNQMELPGFTCPPDCYTYTILIGCYCKHGLHTGCRKATRRRMWEANHLFRLMLFKGFLPDVVTYNCLIDGCCKTYRIERALELFDDMGKRGCVPNRVTYNSFIRYYSRVNEIEKAVEMLRVMERMGHGLASSSSYTPIIHVLCEAGRVVEARDFLVELVERGSVPREYTYKLVCDALVAVGGRDLLDGEFCRRVEDGIEERYRHVKKVKPIVARKIIV